MRHSEPPSNKEQLSQLMDGEWHELNPSECVAGICADEVMRRKWARYHLIRDAMNNEPVGTDEQLVSKICAAIADEPSYSNITPFSPASSRAATDYPELEEQPEPASRQVSALKQVKPASAAKAEAAAGKRSLIGTGVAGFALAASVAAVTVVGMNTWQAQSSSQGSAADNTVADINTAVSTAAALDGRADVFQQEQETLFPAVELVANTGSYWVSPQTLERSQNEKRLNMFLSRHFDNSPTAYREGFLPYSRLVGYDEISQGR